MERALISVHAVDIARGIPAAGLGVELVRREPSGPVVLANAVADVSGKVTFGKEVIAARDLPCRLTLNMRIADYYAGFPSARFITVLPFNFSMPDASYHYHLPAKITPFGLSMFITRSA